MGDLRATLDQMRDAGIDNVLALRGDPPQGHERWTKTVEIVHWDIERLHQRAGVLSKALLARHKRVAVVEVFHLALLEIVGEPDIVMGRKQKAGAFAF